MQSINEDVVSFVGGLKDICQKNHIQDQGKNYVKFYTILHGESPGCGDRAMVTAIDFVVGLETEKAATIPCH